MFVLCSFWQKLHIKKSRLIKATANKPQAHREHGTGSKVINSCDNRLLGKENVSHTSIKCPLRLAAEQLQTSRGRGRPGLDAQQQPTTRGLFLGFQTRPRPSNSPLVVGCWTSGALKSTTMLFLLLFHIICITIFIRFHEIWCSFLFSFLRLSS